jgi:penicillin-binding protein 2
MVRARLKILILLLAAPPAAIIVRLAYLQLVPEVHGRYWLLSQHRTRTFSAPIRGRIISSDGAVLAGNEPLCRIHANYPRLNMRREALSAVIREIRRRSPFPGVEEVEARIVEASDPRALAAGGEDGGDGPGDLLPLVENLDRALAERLARRIKSWPGFFELWPDGRGASSLWYRPRRLLAMEITLHRLAAIIGPPEAAAATYALLRSRIDAEMARVETLVEEEIEADRKDGIREGLIETRKRTVRALLHRSSSWLLASDVPQAAVTAIEYHRHLFPGIEVEDGVRRVYPEGEACGTLTGYLRRIGEEDEKALRAGGRLVDTLDVDVGIDAFSRARERGLRRSDLLATGGLEQFHDDRLRGFYGIRVERLDKMGQPADLLEDIAPEDGEDVRVTVEASLQRVLYEALRASIKPLGGRQAGVAGSAAVMSLAAEELGAVLASVGFPGIDSNRMTHESGPYQKELEALWEPQTDGWLLDRPSRHALYPGSVFKLVLAAAAMESAAPWEGEYTPERLYECTHEFKFVKGLHCSSRAGHGPIDLAGAIQHSCNSYFYYLGLKHLGPEPILQWADRFGYGRPTGIDLPPHKLESGFLGSPAGAQRAGGTCHLSIGQVHVKATPLQVLRSVAAVALGGTVLPRPYLVAPREPPYERLPVGNARAIKAVRDGLWRTGHAGGTAARLELRLHRFSAAYKTGTAEILSGPEAVHHAWLVGFAPFEAPRIAFVIVIEKSPLHGAEACALVANRLLEHFAAKEPGLYYLEDRGEAEERRP